MKVKSYSYMLVEVQLPVLAGELGSGVSEYIVAESVLSAPY